MRRAVDFPAVTESLVSWKRKEQDRDGHDVRTHTR